MKYSKKEIDLFREAGIYVEDKNSTKEERENLKMQVTDYIISQSSKEINNFNKRFSKILD